MRQRISRVLLCVIAVTCFAVLTGCAAKSPEEKIAEIRSQYTVRLNTWVPRDPEPVMADPIADVEGEVAEGAVAMAEEAAAVEVAAVAEDAETMEEGDEEMEADTGPQTRAVFFDLIVRFDGLESLPGITVDITHADAFQKEKGQYHHWLDTAGMVKSDTRQIDFELEDVEFIDGDVFSVALRSPVAPEERGDYREFADVAP